MSTHTLTIAATLQRHTANLITAFRVVCLFLAAAFAVTGDFVLAWIAVPLAFAALLMDWLDGYAARRLGCESKVGGLLDIVGDRIAENVWWVVFAWLHLVPLWVPLVVLSRGFVTDAIRSCALTQGKTAFGETTMMRSPIGYGLVASRTSRAAYGVAKVIAFVALFILNAVQYSTSLDPGLGSGVETVALAATYLTVALCAIRGIPVITAAKRVVI
ncbi:MAG: CDP-alcohol phosphatidyltransferase family protein [Gemmatimonadota bacterium]|nr:CDP-alcohol phosphatidyltransferase family protein [Gemmatimonadota bacterium]